MEYVVIKDGVAVGQSEHVLVFDFDEMKEMMREPDGREDVKVLRDKAMSKGLVGVGKDIQELLLTN